VSRIGVKISLAYEVKAKEPGANPLKVNSTAFISPGGN